MAERLLDLLVDPRDELLATYGTEPPMTQPEVAHGFRPRPVEAVGHLPVSADAVGEVGLVDVKLLPQDPVAAP